MGYTRRRAVLSEIERQCSIALLAYDDCASALQAQDAERFWRSLDGLRLAADRLDQLLQPGDGAEWLGAADLPALRAPVVCSGYLCEMALPDCARFFDSEALPSLLAAVAELSHRAREQMAYLRQVV